MSVSKGLVLTAVIVIVAIGIGAYVLTSQEEQEPGEELAPADFEISDLEVNPSEVKRGEPVSVSVRVSNIGEKTDNYTVKLKVDGSVEETRTITLGGGESIKVSFTVQKNARKSYSVGIGDLSGTFEVIGIPGLSVEGNKLVDEDGNPITLRGVSIADPYRLNHVDNRFSEAIFQELLDWNVNVVRVPIHPGWWQAEKDYAQKYLDSVVQWGRKYGFYIILDWHAIGNPLTGQAQNPGWKEKGYTIYDSSLELAENAWARLAERYGENSHVIFELFNEPTARGSLPKWSTWKSELTDLVDKIRERAENKLILVSGWEWSHNLGGFSTYPIERKNIAYVAHWYPTGEGPRSWEESFGFLSEKYPIVVTEWGFSSTAEGEHYYGSRENFGNLFVRYMENNNMSWTAWCFHPVWGPKLIKNWNYEPTQSGRLVLQVLKPDNESPEISISAPSEGSTVDWTVEIQGTASDDSGLLGVVLKIENESYEGVKSTFDSHYRSVDWSYTWESQLKPNDNYTLTAKAIDTSFNTTTDSVTVEVSNPVDEFPPSVTIETPSDQASLTGSVKIAGSAVDEESGLRKVQVSIDNKERTAWISDEEGTGIFSQANFDDGEWDLTLNTTSVTNGTHTIVAKAVDELGNIGVSSVTVEINNGNLLGDCDNELDWSKYKGGGSKIEMSSDTGAEGKSIRVDYSGSSGGWWGIVKGLYRDFSGYEGIEFYLKGDPNPIRIQLRDSGQEVWVDTLTPSEDWEKVRLPFENFSVRGDWQPTGANKNGSFDHPVWGIQFLHSVAAQDAEGTFWVDQFKLYK